jgi:hypothetical protein
MYDQTRYHDTTRTNRSDRLGLPADATVLGTDGHRATHYYSEAANTVVVVDAADLIDRRWSLAESSLTAWVVHIALERGWDDLRHAEAFLERVAEAMEVA